MALNTSGQISIGGSTTGQSINLELSKAATAASSLNDTDFRTLAGKASGVISLADFYGKSSWTNIYDYFESGTYGDLGSKWSQDSYPSGVCGRMLAGGNPNGCLLIAASDDYGDGAIGQMTLDLGIDISGKTIAFDYKNTDPVAGGWYVLDSNNQLLYGTTTLSYTSNWIRKTLVAPQGARKLQFFIEAYDYSFSSFLIDNLSITTT